jgi:hypothetical protein
LPSKFIRCENLTNNGNPPEDFDIAGTYVFVVGENSYTLEFNKDGTYILVDGPENKSGSWSIDGDEITMVCPTGEEVFIIQQNDSNISLTLKDATKETSVVLAYLGLGDGKSLNLLPNENGTPPPQTELPILGTWHSGQVVIAVLVDDTTYYAYYEIIIEAEKMILNLYKDADFAEIIDPIIFEDGEQTVGSYEYDIYHFEGDIYDKITDNKLLVYELFDDNNQFKWFLRDSVYGIFLNFVH